MTTCDGETLQARVRRPVGTVTGVAVLCHPHPDFGADMDVWLLPAIAERLVRDGWLTVRFNFRGVGGSTGASSRGIDEPNDVRAAVAWGRDEAPGVPVAAVGWSFGAMAALQLGPELDAWVGIGTPTRRVDAVTLRGPLVPAELPPRRTAIVGSDDQFFPPDSTGPLQADLVVIDHADHFLFDRDPEVADAVARALAPLRTGTPSDPTARPG